MNLIDHLIVVDNSDMTGEIVFEAEQGILKYQADALPQWVLGIARNFESR
ncbi:hypothetical protein [Paenibacillus solanacearum]|nr:hypothetical protein [Paenibacillus solanacearum]